MRQPVETQKPGGGAARGLSLSLLDAKQPMEPFRIFFPLGIVLGLLGVAVWPIYALGLGIAPSAAGHVGLQIQGFVMSFAVGFLMTAVPRFVGAPPVKLRSQVLLALVLCGSAAGFWTDRPVVAEGLFVLLMLGLFAVMGTAFRARIAAPPEPFVAAVLGLLAGLTGGVLKLGIVTGHIDPGLMLLARRLLSEGMVLLMVLGIGGKLGPLLLGYPTRSTRGAATYGLLAALVLGSIVAQYGFGLEAAAWVRAGVMVLACAWNVRFWRAPQTRSALSFGVWVSHWMLMMGLIWSAALPPLRVEGLHLVFVGGFSILILSVAMRVVLSHRGYPLAWEVSSRPLKFGIALFVLATLTRIGARFTEDSYLMHLGLAGGFWLTGLLVWGAVLVYRILVPYSGDRPEHGPAP